jgi:predicted transcriptional regulator
MPDESPPPSFHLTLRVPHDVVEAFDKLAGILERPRSWVMLRALRQYLGAEGAEMLADLESLAQLDRGEGAPFGDVLVEIDDIIDKAEAKRAGR